MSKIVFFDIDGTLLDDDKKLPQATKEAIQTLQANGTYVAIATGRAPFMYEELRKELGIDSYVSFNGQYVVFENKVIYKNPLNNVVLKELLNDSERRDHPVVFLNQNTMKSTVKHHPFIKESMESLKFPHPDYQPDFYSDKEIYQSLLFCRQEEEDYYRENYRDFSFIRWHEYSMDILPRGGSKAEGIKKMIAELGFKLEDVYAFGDGLNDIEMIEAVGTGVAMGNAVEEVKKHASLVTKHVDDNGIYFGLKKLKLI
ncbi:Cof subfamily protein (haloacid dehalogenase superfamily) [Bacillus pakistanensis]|uniref:Cof subfamily protein (Haloacid dehalogenase superfamily) n=1 Tax=Rossellomorea pakistanensis TaxID=992288 RepID=A0ABS2NGD9_9BACI|nr:Cof-type HAD-IIB family hydrolase [Bacillus pakistanensis]MBM7586661.1 Cof subfamily protein (haloacid dehalogenase superfamily) [Bacillus pakistanensis]